MIQGQGHGTIMVSCPCSQKENAMSRKKQVYEKITALYCRISLDDGGDNESMSISNQKLMLRDFAEKHGMFQYEYYVDDGYTGRNFNRPSFQRMIADIEAGKIGCVVTKDLSRLGRNYIEAGSYIEIFFPKHNVRYIAITDGVDSLTRQEMDITPFKNILNDMYSRDISKKVLAGITTRSRQGKFCGGTPPFGLMRDPEDKGHLIIDPETAPIIRKIYDYALDGLGCMRISKRLMEEKIPITHVKANTEFDANYYSWGGARISHILRNPFYKGAHLVFRTHQKGIRSNTYDIIPRDQWEVIEGCHEAIVTPEEWEQEQESNQKRLHDLAMMQSRADAQESEVRTFIKEIRRYATIEELDEAVLNRLISRILIGEVKKVDGQKVQKVKIVYNFVGEIPEIAA